MISTNYKIKILQFLICINLLLILIFIIKNSFDKIEDTIFKNKIITSTIHFDEFNAKIDVEYPRFYQNDELNKIITDYIYSYIKDFKNNYENKYLKITYDIFYIKNFINIAFNINNSLSKVKYKNIFLDLKLNKTAYISNILDSKYLENEINKAIYNKYDTDIYNRILNQNLNNFTYIMDDEKMKIYFNNIEWKNIDSIPFVTLNYNEEISYVNTNTYPKYIAFTFDDGPSKYTNKILKILENNNSSATFFLIGNKIKSNEDIVKNINNSNSEIGIHGFNHINFKNLSLNQINNEINSTNIILNNTINTKSILIRPPYGEYNSNIYNLNYNIILWNIDSKDWLVRNENKIYNNVINNACDGCIVILHDTYNETYNAIKKLIPELNNIGFKVVSVSKLIKIKKCNQKNNRIISYVK